MRNWRLPSFFALVVLISTQSAHAQPPGRHVAPASLDKNSRALFEDSMALDQ